MAVKKAKLSARKKQSAPSNPSRLIRPAVGRQSARPKNRTSRTRRSPTRYGIFHFPEVTGKIVEGVELVTDSGYDVISLSFGDSTCLDFMIETCFTVRASYLDRGHGDHRVLKKWPAMHSS